MYYRVIKPVLQLSFNSDNLTLDVLKDILEAGEELESESFITFERLDAAVKSLKEYFKKEHGVDCEIEYTYYDETIEETDDYSRKQGG